MNIAIVIGRIPSRGPADAEVEARRLAAQLAARGHRVTVVVSRRPSEAAVETRDGYTIVHPPATLPGPLRVLSDLVITPLRYRRIKPRPHFTLAFGTFPGGVTSGFIDIFQRIHSVVWVRGED